MSDSLRDKVVVISGASSGIGRSLAFECASRGATLILLARNKEKLHKVATETKELSGTAVYDLPTDLGESKQIDAAFKQIVKVTDHVDFLVNSAGFGKFEDFVKMERHEVTDMFQVNVLGLMYFTRLIGRLMMDQKRGQIINIGSIAGKIPTTKTAAYSASKAAVIQFSNVLRLELKPFNVKVMTVNPGPVYTNFFNIADKTGDYAEKVERFMLDPDDVAWQIVHFFGSNKRELNLPFSLSVLERLYNLFPTIGDWCALKFADKK